MSTQDIDPAAGRLAEALADIAGIRLGSYSGVANHWISDRALPTPDANRDTFTTLERASELSPELAEKLRGWAGFRNVLVHEYLEIDLRMLGTPTYLEGKGEEGHASVYSNVSGFSLKIAASASPLSPASGKPFFSPTTRCAT